MFIENSLKVGSMTPPINCREINHPGLSCNHYAIYKFWAIFNSVLKVMAVAYLLPTLVQKYNKLDREQIKLIVTRFLRATLACTLCTWMPPLLGCHVSQRMKTSPRSIFALIFAIGGAAMSIDTKHRQKQSALFLSPKVL